VLTDDTLTTQQRLLSDIFSHLFRIGAPDVMTTEAEYSQQVVSYDTAQQRSLIDRARVFITLFDQALVSIASFFTNFLLLRHFAGDSEHYAYYTLAFNLMIWAAEFQAMLVLTPHTMRTPRLSGRQLRQFHGSTLLHSTAVSLLTSAGMLISAVIAAGHDVQMSHVLLALAGGLLVIGLRNYVRPYLFAAKSPMTAVAVDLTAAVVQIGGLLLLQRAGHLNAWSAILMTAVAAAIPSLIWLFTARRRFEPHLGNALVDFKQDWIVTRWVFLSGMTWNIGMQLYPWLIASTRDKQDVAMWGACFQLACVANPLLMGLQNFIGPRIAEACVELSSRAFVKHVYKTCLTTTFLMTGPAVVLSIFADDALHWITRGQSSGHAVTITLLCTAIVIQAGTFTLSRGLFAMQRADIDMYCNTLPMVVLFTVGLWATSHYGIAGAAASMVLAQVLAVASRAIWFGIAAKKQTPPTHPAFDVIVEAQP
jgi:O-antigen/teichoic acid export membrane protein